MLFLSLFHRRPIILTVHTGARTSSTTHPNSDMQVPLCEQGRDQITYAHGVIIIQVCGVLICTENAYHANTRWHRHEGGSSLTYSRDGPQHVCGVALCSMSHFVLRVDSGGSPTDSRGGPHSFKRWPPSRVVWHFTLCDTLFCVGNGFQRWPLQI